MTSVGVGYSSSLKVAYTVSVVTVLIIGRVLSDI